MIPLGQVGLVGARGSSVHRHSTSAASCLLTAGWGFPDGLPGTTFLRGRPTSSPPMRKSAINWAIMRSRRQTPDRSESHPARWWGTIRGRAGILRGRLRPSSGLTADLRPTPPSQSFPSRPSETGPRMPGPGTVPGPRVRANYGSAVARLGSRYPFFHQAKFQ